MRSRSAGADVLHHRHRAGTGLRRERARHEKFAQPLGQRRLAHATGDQLDHLFRTRRPLFQAAQHAAVKREVRVLPGRGQIGRGSVEQPYAQVALPRIQRRLARQQVDAGDEARLRHHRLAAVERQRAQQRRPVEPAARIVQRLGGAQVVKHVGVAHVGALHRRLRQPRLEHHDRRGITTRRVGRRPRQFEQQPHVVAIAVAHLARARIVAEVVVAIGQAQPRLPQRHPMAALVARIGRHADRHRCRQPDLGQPCHRSRQRRTVG